MWYVWYAWYVWLMIVSISIPPRSPRHPSSIQIVGDSDLDLAEPGDQKMEVIPSGPLVMSK